MKDKTCHQVSAGERGLFITFEGVEGCGKTTQALLLAEKLRQVGLDVLLTREPGGTQIGDRIRGLLLGRENSALSATTELLLYAASRRQHVDEVIAPALRRGVSVLCDRFADSTVAYQGFGLGLSFEWIAWLHRIATEGLEPDITLLLDLDPAVGFRRKFDREVCEAKDASEKDRIEERSLAFHRKVRQGFLKIAKDHPERVVVVDGAASSDAIAQQIKATVMARLLEKGLPKGGNP